MLGNGDHSKGDNDATPSHLIEVGDGTVISSRDVARQCELFVDLHDYRRCDKCQIRERLKEIRLRRVHLKTYNEQVMQEMCSLRGEKTKTLLLVRHLLNVFADQIKLPTLRPVFSDNADEYLPIEMQCYTELTLLITLQQLLVKNCGHITAPFHSLLKLKERIDDELGDKDGGLDLSNKDKYLDWQCEFGEFRHDMAETLLRCKETCLALVSARHLARRQLEEQRIKTIITIEKVIADTKKRRDEKEEEREAVIDGINANMADLEKARRYQLGKQDALIDALGHYGISSIDWGFDKLEEELKGAQLECVQIENEITAKKLKSERLTEEVISLERAIEECEDAIVTRNYSVG